MAVAEQQNGGPKSDPVHAVGLVKGSERHAVVKKQDPVRMSWSGSYFRKLATRMASGENRDGHPPLKTTNRPIAPITTIGVMASDVAVIRERTRKVLNGVST